MDNYGDKHMRGEGTITIEKGYTGGGGHSGYGRDDGYGHSGGGYGGGYGGHGGGGGCSVSNSYNFLCAGLLVAGGVAAAAAAAAAIFLLVTGGKRKRRSLGQIFTDIDNILWIPEGWSQPIVIFSLCVSLHNLKDLKKP